ncbi:MAG: glycerol-3-phosphate dehydrogenase/oxidase [Flavobacteriales bacterium]|nr:glycerol-3-phosphate dehydrogenase/oxidase [Flavobacteriales bacterium]
MNREEHIALLKEQHFDVLVIGGGITGVGIALDAQSRGLKTALIEKLDFASGTSSRSTKLIHGGLRYLKQFEFRLVNEVGRERAVVHKIAPHLVHPDKMLLPLVKDGNYGYLLTNMGLSVYDFLAGVEGADRKRMLDKSETEKMEPLLRKDILEGGGYYAEYRTDDSRLVMALARTAESKGVTLANYVEFEDFITREGKIFGATAMDAELKEKFEINASMVVNATGPWVDEIRKSDGSLSGKHLFLSKGVHIVVPKERFPVQQTVYFDNEDGRMVFAIPRGRITYVGTTDTHYDKEKEEPHVTTKDVKYILDAVNYMFPSIGLRTSDVISSWAGLRPLIHEEGKDPSAISRKDEIFESESGLISIAGGKLTGYRKMSERVVDKLVKRFDHKLLPCTTDGIQVVGGSFASYQDVQALVDKLFTEYPKLLRSFEDAEYLVHNFGTDAELILQRAGLHRVEAHQALIAAEAEYCCVNEMVVHADDFFERRTGRINFEPSSAVIHHEMAISVMAPLLGWSVEDQKREKQRVLNSLKRVTQFH